LYTDPDATVTGLDQFPRRDWPPVAVVHIAFQVMVGLGSVLAALTLWAWWLWWKRRPLVDHSWLLRSLVVAAPFGMLAIEAGWVVTEVGRQPWIIYGVMRTAKAVTPMPGITVSFVLFTLLYMLLALVVVWTLWRHVAATEKISREA
jgi:cytochrome d ubiquinol oxidase subunit I